MLAAHAVESPHLADGFMQDLLGRGALWSKRPLIGYAFGGLRDAGFGIYARVDQIRNTLQGRWAGKLLTVLIDPNFAPSLLLLSALQTT